MNFLDRFFDNPKMVMNQLDFFNVRFKNVRENSWREKYTIHEKKEEDRPLSIVEGRSMSGVDRNRRNFGILSSLRAGKSLREIGERVGLDHKQVYRIGASRGVYSVRSARA